MAWIRTIAENEAEGLLATIYQSALQRTGRVFNILRVQSRNPKSLRAGLGLYRETILADSPVSRILREMIATVVSKTNGCHY